MVAARIKFCGLMRAEDVRQASVLGAAYVGVIFAGGPRLVTGAAAAAALEAAADGVRRVGVFGGGDPGAVAELASAAGLDVVQLHADPDGDAVESVRRRFGGEIWAVIRCRDGRLPDNAESLFAEADGIVLDAFATTGLGGTGVTLDWSQLRGPVDRLRGSTPVVLAGGLRPENVAQAVTELAPDVVDVSSGVESSPGVKDHRRMRAFVQAVKGACVNA